jgi:hypothetical protein
MSTVIVLLLIAGVLFFIFFRDGTKEQPKETPPVTQPHPQVDPDADLLKSIEIFRDKMLSDAKSASDAKWTSQGSDQQKIDRANRFVYESNLGRGLTDFMGTMFVSKHAAMTSSEDKPVAGKGGMQIVGAGGDLGKHEWMEFYYGSHRYKVDNNPGDFDDDLGAFRGNASLYCDGKEVLRIGTRQGNEYFVWFFDKGSVEVFHRGDWIPEMIELFTKIEIESNQFMSDAMANSDKGRASRITE